MFEQLVREAAEKKKDPKKEAKGHKDKEDKKVHAHAHGHGTHA